MHIRFLRYLASMNRDRRVVVAIGKVLKSRRAFALNFRPFIGNDVSFSVVVDGSTWCGARHKFAHSYILAA